MFRGKRFQKQQREDKANLALLGRRHIRGPKCRSASARLKKDPLSLCGISGRRSSTASNHTLRLGYELWKTTMMGK